MLDKSHCMSSASESKKEGTILGISWIFHNAKRVGEHLQPYVVTESECWLRYLSLSDLVLYTRYVTLIKRASGRESQII